MKNTILFFIIICSFFTKAYSQINGTDFIIGQDFKLESKILGEERGIQVYLPKGYKKDSLQLYPVLYVLDGQEYFLHGIAYQDMLHFRDKSPEFIVVGIKTDRKRRRLLFFNEADKFIGFLKKELIPFIDTNFRTKKEQERMIFGWEMGGGLALQLLGEQKELFSGYIVASPTHGNRRMEALKRMKNDKSESNTFLLLTAAPEEHWITEDSTFLSVINSKTPHSQLWRYSILEREDHYTTPLKTIHEGLSDYFQDYKPIRLRSLKAYDEYGGLDALRTYYKKRGERYNLPTAIHNETKHFLIYNAMTEDNYERFKFYVNEFDGYLETKSRDLWLNRYAKFYLKHNNVKQALYLFHFGIDKFPNSALLYKGLGDVYFDQGNSNKALNVYKKALSLNPEMTSIKERINILNKN